MGVSIAIPIFSRGDLIKLSELKDSIEQSCRVSNHDGAFSLALICSFSKSIGLALEIENSTFENKSFWISSALRSICEDLIVLSFIDKNFRTEADEIVKLQLNVDTKKSLEAQDEFYSKYRPQQPIIKPKDSSSNPEDRLRVIYKNHIQGKKQYKPSVWAMAKDQDLGILYSYLYHATSRFVHFSPNTLLKMAWYNPENEESQCDPNAFNNYYYQFVKFYSIQLLSSLVNRFPEKIIIEDKLKQSIKERLDEANSIQRWPELVTFEELNADSPWNEDGFARKNSFWNIFVPDPEVIFVPKC